jgi:hypothetical protein
MLRKLRNISGNLSAGSLLIFGPTQLSRGVAGPHGIGGWSFSTSFVFLSAILHVFVIVICCFGLGIRDPWKWYKESSMRAQRAAYERAEVLAALDPDGPSWE